MNNVIPHWVTKQAYLSPGKTAMETESGEVISFIELKEKSVCVAKKLQAWGVEKGSHVAILSKNTSDFIITIHALSYIGAVAVLLNVRLTKEEISYQLKDSHTSLLVTCDDMEQTALDMRLPVEVQTYSGINAIDEGDHTVRDEITLDEAFTIIYTSGTTGFPKGVIHTYGNHWWSAIGSMLNLGLKDNDKWLATLPFYHVGGLSIFIRSVIYGIPVYMVDKFEETSVHQAIMEKNVTIASVVPVMLKRLLHKLDNTYYPSSFRCMLLGGSGASSGLLERAKSKYVPVFQSYGMTETSSQIVTLSPDNALKKIGSSGKSLFPASVEIRDQGSDGIGEIYVKGPMVTSGYYNNESATQEAIKNGWLRTGDLGYMDGEGFLYVVDRRKDLIISGGENIYPSEIEAVLLRIEGIKEAAVAGMDDDEWGKVPFACVVGDESKVSREYILYRLKASLASFKVPKKIIFVPSLPRNSSRKILRKSLLTYVKQKKMV